MSEGLIFNEGAGRYEKLVDGHTVYANARIKDRVVSIDYVYAPPELRGTGAAGTFMADLMGQIKAEGMKVYPICGFAVSWLRKHEAEYKNLIA